MKKKEVKMILSMVDRSEKKKLKKKCCKKYKKKAVHCGKCPKAYACQVKLKLAEIAA